MLRREEEIHCYKGHIIDLQDNLIMCRFINQQDEDDEVFVEFYDHVLKPKDRLKGRLLRWTYGWHRKGGKLRSFNEVKPIDIKLTDKQIQKAIRQANQIAKMLKWCIEE